MTAQSLRPTPAMVVALIALAVAVGGTAVAANKIGTGQIKNNAITKKKIKKKAVSTNRLADKAVKDAKIAGGAVTLTKLAYGAVGATEIAGGGVGSTEIADGAVGATEMAGGGVGSSEIADNAVDGAKVADGSLDGSKLSDYENFSPTFVRAAATNGINQDVARSNAPEIPLYSKGPLDVYAKCWHNTLGNATYGGIFARTSTPFSIMKGDDEYFGGPAANDYLNPGTDEGSRRIQWLDATGSAAPYSDGAGMVGAADGTAIALTTGIGVKNGSVFADGPYGTGNACIFQGTVFG